MAGQRAPLRSERQWLIADLICGLAGLGLVATQAAVLVLSRRFVYGSPHIDRPTLATVGLLVSAGFFFLIAVYFARRCRGWTPLIGVIAIGIAMRVLTFCSTPILEDDFYRYLWDGGVVAHGANPYRYAPNDPPPSLQALAADSGVVNERVNHADLRTVYPPVAQAAFAAAHWLKPWSLSAWKLVLSVGDIATALLLIALLRELRLPTLLIIIYWWNPLLVKEVYNTAHLDVLTLPFVLGALLLALRRRTTWSVVLLALGVGMKIWPLLLLPVVLRPVLRQPRKAVAALAAFAVVALAVLAPMMAAPMGEGSGLSAYASGWQMNDALFMSIDWALRPLAEWVGADGGAASRIVVGLLLLAGIAWLLRQPAEDGLAVCERCLFVVAGAFLLSPTQFPWYSLWFLPFLVLRPRGSLLLLSALLPVYYLRFYLFGCGMVDMYDYRVVWVQYLPVWIWLLWEWRTGRNLFKTPALPYPEPTSAL
jgi:alpha-1,6-mannosyltransferase